MKLRRVQVLNDGHWPYGIVFADDPQGPSLAQVFTHRKHAKILAALCNSMVPDAKPKTKPKR